uniref:BTB domain-containing protein n=1 Tax=Ditylenchus dipsaci TaxID=166011 RepID=A0A915DWW7_9BILA
MEYPEFHQVDAAFEEWSCNDEQTVFSPQAPKILWEFHLYPSGKREEDANCISVFLRQVGMELNEGPITTGFQIYAVSDKNERVNICRDTKDFSNQQGRGKFKVARDKIYPVVHADGSIFLVCELEFLLPGVKVGVESPAGANRGLSYPQELFLRAANREMWQKELFTDCEIQVGTKSFFAHRCVLGQHSNVFRSMFAQSIMLEAKNRKLIITDADPLQVHAMLEFLYTGSICLDQMDLLAEGVLCLADKYAIVTLKLHCELYLVSKLSVANVPQMVVVADEYFASILRKECVRFVGDNVSAVFRNDQWKELKQSHAELVSGVLEEVLMDQEDLSSVDACNSDDGTENSFDLQNSHKMMSS